MKVHTGFPRIDAVCNSDPEPERALELFKSRRITAETLALELKLHGFSVSASTIRTFRREQRRTNG